MILMTQILSNGSPACRHLVRNLTNYHHNKHDIRKRENYDFFFNSIFILQNNNLLNAKVFYSVWYFYNVLTMCASVAITGYLALIAPMFIISFGLLRTNIVLMKKQIVHKCILVYRLFSVIIDCLALQNSVISLKTFKCSAWKAT